MPILAGAALMASHSDHTVSTVTAVILALMGVSIIAVLVANSAKTAGVTTSGGTAIANIICTALSPVTHGSCGGLIPNVQSKITFGAPVGG